MTDLPALTETFVVTADNPLLRGHVVYGRSLLPGVGYVDLVLQVLARHGHPMPEVELRNLTILAPLVVEPGDRAVVTVEGRTAPSGGWRIEVRSRRPRETVEVTHAAVTAHRRPTSTFSERLSLPVSGAMRHIPLTDVYAWCLEHRLVHSGLMRIDGTVHCRPQDWIAEIELAPAHQDSADAFLFHPALFEAGLLGGGVAIGMLHEENHGPGLYLPLMFESFRATAPLGRRCLVRVPADSVRRDDELVRLAVEFYDQTGTKVAEVGQFVAKRVRAESALDVRGEAAGVRPEAPLRETPAVPASTVASTGNVAAVVRDLVAARLARPSAQIGTNTGYYELGLASADLLGLVADLEDRLALPLSPTIVFEHRTIADLAAWLESQLPERTPTVTPVATGDAAPVDGDPTDATRAALTDEVAALLAVPTGEIDPDAEFTELGLDWAGLAQLTDRLHERYGLTLGPTVLVERQTVRALAAYLVTAHRDHVVAGPVDAAPTPVPAGPAAPTGAAPVSAHPMLRRAGSDDDGVTYRTRFDGSEPYLRDHRVRDALVLPGVAQLEVARAAVAHALAEDHPDRVRLDDIVWLRPAVCGPDGLELLVKVRPSTRGDWEYTIECLGADGFELCSRGRAVRSVTAARPTPHLADLRAACTGPTLTAADVYHLFGQAGLDYGPAQRALVRLDVGTDQVGRPQVLAELRLPPEAEPLDGCLLHPSITDGALQATIGLWLAGTGTDGQPARPALPFALQGLTVAAATPVRAYAWLRYQSGEPGTPSARLDVTILDEQGRTCVEMTGLATRTLPDVAQQRVPVGQPDDTDRPVPPTPVTVGTDIAIVGVSGRYPEAADLDEFWRNLRSGRDCIREIPTERWDHSRYAEAGGPAKARWGGFLDDIDRFDPLFFQISLLEADYLDPQERLFLQCAHHTLEDAGYTGELLARTALGAGRTTTPLPPARVGVFVGVMYQEYQLFGAQAQERGHPVALSGSASTVANRVSYFYNFSGPSMAVDTMCSSSLTAIHLACEAIRSGQCDAALAGGVNLSPHPNKYLMLGQRNFLSSDGRCRSFGAGGDGYVPAEGVGAVLLKPLDRAVADGDHIYGVIKATAVNHGGRTPGYSVPSPTAQGEVIAQALAAAGIDPREVSYLEAHGTGTSLGDPIEVTGLAKAFERVGGLPEHCAVGSVKSNIGHGESAAGIAGVTKVLLQMRHGELVPSLHSGALNPHIDTTRTRLRVPQRVEPWRRPTVEIDGERRTVPRVAGVSSFGAGGANAHVVIAEYVPPARPPAQSAPDRRPALLVLSAMSEAQLVEQARRLHARLAELPDDSLPDVAWTLQTGRIALEERLALAATTRQEALTLLASFAADPGRPGGWVRGRARPERETSTAQAEADLRSAWADWTERGGYQRLARLWVDGAAVRWEQATTRARRVGLPGYPFARERCWLDLEIGGLPAAPRGGAPATAPGTTETPRSSETAEAPGSSETAEAPGSSETTEADETLLLRPRWAERDIAPAAVAGTYSAWHVVVVGRLSARERDGLRAALPAATTCRFVALGDGAPDHRYTEVTQRVFDLTRDLLVAGVRHPTLLQVVLVGAAAPGAEAAELACLGGLAGLLKTAHLENPHLRTQYVECLDDASVDTVAARLTAEATPEPEPEVRHRAGRRYVARLAEVHPVRPASTPWREDGVYLVTGGAGALGLIVAREIAASVRHATVILTGRSPLSAARRADLDALRAAGLTVSYQRADVADRDSVARLLAHVADNHGPLTGILHSAGLIDDALIVRKSPDTVARVLAPKVAGLVNLDELSRDQPLDVLACFSSTSGAFGNPGQADYAAANAFLGSYAAYRNHLVDAGLRRGRTVVVDWPLWAEGGMGADGPVREHLRSMGFAPLGTADGLRALRCALATRENGLDEGRLVVLVGRRSAVLPRLVTADEGSWTVTTSTTPDVPAGAVGSPERTVATGHRAGHALEERVVGVVRRMVAGALKLGPERLDPDTPLERYGMDSVIAVSVISGWEESFGPLSRTLLFEVPTVRELARYFVAEHGQAVRTLLGETATPTPPADLPASTSDAPVAAHVPQHPDPSPDPVGRARPAASDTVVHDRPVGPDEPRHDRDDDVAIIGISGRYPQAEDLDAFWANLRAGRDCVTELPTDRWGDGADPTRGWWGGFLDGIDRFDPLLFGISPREAAAMDPQQRLFLETVWHLLEQGGVTQEVLDRRYGRRVGVYVGAAYQMYQADGTDPGLAALTSAASYNLIANRVSYFFGLEGPSLAVDSMCTSSAMAVHLACADLQRGESELAIAGGVNLTVHPDKYLALAEMQLLGSHPGSRSFRAGDGYLPAEAVGAVLLKPLRAALRDGDPIHAVIKGTASAHGGRANGFMTPSHRTQVSVMRRALARAGVEPASIGYVEAAANGATLSDEVEVTALREVFRGVTGPVALGTVKSNLGHPEAASGIAQLTKAVLQLRHRQLAPLVPVGDPNPNLDLDGTPLRLCDRLTDWAPVAPGDDHHSSPHRVLINSVAAGGSHVSLVVEAAPPTPAAVPDPGDTGGEVVLLSARTTDRLRTAARRLHDVLDRDDAPLLADIAYTSQVGREAQPERLAVVAASRRELRQALARYLAAEAGGDVVPAALLYQGNAEEDTGPLGTVLAGVRGEEFLAGLVADGDLERLAELWVRGVRVPWRGLHHGPRRLVPLPATVFEPGRYWVGRQPEQPVPAAGSATPGRDAGTVGGDPSAARAPDGSLADAQRTMASAWAELLQIDVAQLDATSNFFSLGGNSLLAARLINLLTRQTGVELPVQVVFDAPRLADMAAELGRRAPAAEAADAPDLARILESISLIESLSDEELDALDLRN